MITQNFASPSFQLSFDPLVPCVEMKVQGYLSDNEFRGPTEEMLSLMIDKNVTKVFADTLHMKLINQEDREWIKKNFLPKAIKAGLKAVAFIKPADYHTRLSLETTIYGIDPNEFLTEWFDDSSEAKAWLKSLS